jgi:hypothetical protein
MAAVIATIEREKDGSEIVVVRDCLTAKPQATSQSPHDQFDTACLLSAIEKCRRPSSRLKIEKEARRCRTRLLARYRR